MKRSRAIRGVENCAFAWVVFGESVRNLDLAESINARSKKAQKPEGLNYTVEGKHGEVISKPYLAELHTCVYRPTERNQALTRAGYQTVKEANQFAEMVKA